MLCNEEFGCDCEDRIKQLEEALVSAPVPLNVFGIGQWANEYEQWWAQYVAPVLNRGVQ